MGRATSPPMGKGKPRRLSRPGIARTVNPRTAAIRAQVTQPGCRLPTLLVPYDRCLHQCAPLPRVATVPSPTVVAADGRQAVPNAWGRRVFRFGACSVAWPKATQGCVAPLCLAVLRRRDRASLSGGSYRVRIAPVRPSSGDLVASTTLSRRWRHAIGLHVASVRMSLTSSRCLYLSSLGVVAPLLLILFIVRTGRYCQTTRMGCLRGRRTNR